MPLDFLQHFQSWDTADFLLAGVVAGIWLLRFLYDLFFNGRLALQKVPPAGSASYPVTVFMVERNEEENLRTLLPDWLQMGYPSYEVLVVDDFSEDNSPAVLGFLRSQYPRLKVTSLNQETRFSEKLARNLALKAASHDVVVNIPPSAKVPDFHWLPGISAALARNHEVIIGYTGLVPQKGRAHIMYRVESFFRQMESMAFSLNRLPFVTSEENVAFLKKEYFRTGGLAGKIREEYLNLEMVINKIMKPGKVAVLPAANLSLRREMAVDSVVLNDLYHRSFRLRAHLRPAIRFSLRISEWTSILLIPGFLVLFLLYPGLWVIWVSLLIVKSLVYLLIIKRLQNRLQEQKIFVPSLLYGIIAPYYRLGVKWRFNNSRKRRKWGM